MDHPRLLKLLHVIFNKSIGRVVQLVAFSCPSAYKQPLCVAVYWFVATQQLKFAFFSPSFAEDGGTDEDEDDDERKRRLTFIFGIVGATLFVLAVLMVGIGLKMSSNADSNSKFPLTDWFISYYRHMLVAATVKQQNQTRMLSHTHTHTQRHLAIVRSTKQELYLEIWNIRSSIVDIDSLLLYSSNFLFIRRRGPPYI